jgi:hypothetical protein
MGYWNMEHIIYGRVSCSRNAWKEQATYFIINIIIIIIS